MEGGGCLIVVHVVSVLCFFLCAPVSPTDNSLRPSSDNTETHIETRVCSHNSQFFFNNVPLYASLTSVYSH